MRKSLGLSVFALAFAALPSLVLADCGCGSSVQSAPQAAVVAPAAPVVSQPAVVAAPQIATAPVVNRSNYRRFSYQPQARSHYRSTFEIPKGDTHRYTH